MLIQKVDDSDSRSKMAGQKFPYIDSLRGLAILMVICVHHSQQFEHIGWIASLAGFGQMGVQLFFVVSAYTLCMSADGRAIEKNNIRNFYIRRFFRIAPLYYIGIFIYLLISIISDNYKDFIQKYSLINVMSNVFLLHGMVPTANNSVVPGGWSIGTEMLFYTIFPLMVPIFKWMGKYPLRFLVVFSISILVNGIFQVLVFKIFSTKIQNNTFLYFFITNQMPVFVIGSYAYNTYKSKKYININKYLMGFLVGCAATAVLLYFGTPKTSLLLPPVAGLAFFALVRLAEALPYRTGLLEKIGQVSYSMYVFHFLFAVYATNIILRICGHDRGTELLMYLPTLLLAIILTFAIAQISKRLVEDRFIEVGREIIRRLS